MGTLKVFSGRSNRPLAESIARSIGEPLERCEIKTFSDGEIWAKYADNIRGSDVFIVQSTHPPAENLLELLIMIDAARRSSARKVAAVIPYFGYARQDRKDQPRVSITAKLVANLITEAGADRVITMHLHAPQIQGFFDIPVDHLYSSALLVKYFRKRKINQLAVASPDVGGLKMARAYAKRLEADLIVIEHRLPMKTFRWNRLLTWLPLGLACNLVPSTAHACATCFGQSDSDLAKGMNMGILTLLVVVSCVLGSILRFFVYVVRRSARVTASPLPTRTSSAAWTTARRSM